MIITFTIHGTPIAKARPRSAMITPRGGGKPFITNYTPKKTANYENLVSMSFRQTHCGPPTNGPCALEIRMYFPIPQAWPKYKKAECLKNAYPVIKRPDIDNLIKSILDGLNSVAYIDDKQVYRIDCSKWYSEEPRTEVKVSFPAENEAKEDSIQREMNLGIDDNLPF